MKISKRSRQHVSKILAVFMLLSTVLGGFFQIPVQAVEKHWAYDTLEKWKADGFLKGDSQGNLRPDAHITRAEFMALVNKVEGYTKKSDAVSKYKDIKKSDWYYDSVAVALEAGYIKGISKTQMAPNQTITREQAMVILAKLTGGYTNEKTEGLRFAIDSYQVSDWAKGAVSKCIREGYISGNKGSVMPREKLTRAQAVVMLDHRRQDRRVFGLPGVYDLKGKNVSSVEIASSGVVLKNAKVKNNLTVKKTVGEGNVTLDNVNVQRNLLVYGGGDHSLYFNSVRVDGSLIVKKANGKVRIVASGKTHSKMTVLNSGAILVTQSVDGKVFENVVIPKNMIVGQKVQLVGQFEKVQNNAKGVFLEIRGDVKTLEIKESTTLNGKGNIENLKVDKDVKLTLNKGQYTDGKKEYSDFLIGKSKKPVASSSSSGSSSGGSSSSSNWGKDNDDDDSGNTPVKPTEKTLETLAFKKSTYEVFGEASLAEEVVYKPEELKAEQKEITWSSDNEKVKISDKGVVSGASGEEATIRIQSKKNQNINASTKVKLKKAIQSLKITSQPAQKIYFTGEKLDLTGLEVKAIYEDLTEEVLKIESGDISGFDSSKDVENQVLTVKKGEKTVTFTICVVKAISENAVLVGIDTPLALTFENGIEKEALKKALPASVQISYTISGGSIESTSSSAMAYKGKLPVNWKEIKGYNSDIKEGQSFSVSGSAVLTKNLKNPDKISLDMAVPVKVSAKQWLVSFEIPHEKNLKAQRVSHKGIVKTPVAPEIEGHIFLGFKTENRLDAQAFDFNLPIEKDTIVYGIYKIKTYTVNFHSNHPKTNKPIEIKSQSINHGAKLADTGIKIEGHRVNWFKDKEFKEPFDLNTPIKAPCELYGKWEQVNQLEEATKALTFDVIKGSNTKGIEEVRYNLNLVKVLNDYPDVKISWTTSNKDIVTEEGVVALTDENQSVTLTATLQEKENTKTKSFAVTVLKKQEGIGYIDPRFEAGYPKAKFDNEGRITLEVKLKEGAASAEKPLELFVVFTEEEKGLKDPQNVLLGVWGDNTDYWRESFYFEIKDNKDYEIQTGERLDWDNTFSFVLRDGKNLSDQVTDLYIKKSTENELDTNAPKLAKWNDEYDDKNREKSVFINKKKDKIYVYFDEALDIKAVPDKGDFAILDKDEKVQGKITHVAVANDKDEDYGYVELTVEGLDAKTEYVLSYTPGKTAIQDQANPKPNGVKSEFKEIIFSVDKEFTDVYLGHKKDKIGFFVKGSGWVIPGKDKDFVVDALEEDKVLHALETNSERWPLHRKEKLRLNAPLSGKAFTLKVNEKSEAIDMTGDRVEPTDFVASDANTTYLKKLTFAQKAAYNKKNKEIFIPLTQGMFGFAHSGVYFELVINNEVYHLQAENVKLHRSYSHEGKKKKGIAAKDHRSKYSYFNSYIVPKLEAAFATNQKVTLRYNPALFKGSNANWIEDVAGDLLIEKDDVGTKTIEWTVAPE